MKVKLIDMTDRFIGKWTDKTGKTLVIARDRNRLQVDFYENSSLEPASRKLANGKYSPSLKMTSYLDGTVLLVEVGTDGVGSILRLDYHVMNGKECLVPELEHGLYGENEPDFGVPWLFPLDIYERLSK